jgi:hypothetical protein
LGTVTSSQLTTTASQLGCHLTVQRARLAIWSAASDSGTSTIRVSSEA